jgi:hypothetical protein
VNDHNWIRAPGVPWGVKEQAWKLILLGLTDNAISQMAFPGGAAPRRPTIAKVREELNLLPVHMVEAIGDETVKAFVQRNNDFFDAWAASQRAFMRRVRARAMPAPPKSALDDTLMSR